MNRVIQTGVSQEIMYAARECFRPETPMHEPLLVPDCLESPRRHLGHLGAHMRRSEGAEPCHGPRMMIRIARVQRYGHATDFVGYLNGRDQQLRGIEVCLKKHVNVDPLGQITAV